MLNERLCQFGFFHLIGNIDYVFHVAMMNNNKIYHMLMICSKHCLRPLSNPSELYSFTLNANITFCQITILH